MAPTYFPLKFCTVFIEFRLRKIKVSRIELLSVLATRS